MKETAQILTTLVKAPCVGGLKNCNDLSIVLDKYSVHYNEFA